MAKRTKTNPFDWATIGWARTVEESERVDFSNESAALEAERDSCGRLVDPIAYLTARAEALLTSVGASVERFRERAKRVWIFSLLLVVALGAFAFPFARADRLLDGGVNLAGPFVFFLLGQIFFLGTSLIFVLIAALQAIARRLRADAGPQTSAERAVARFSGLIGWLALSAIRRGTPLFYALGETKFFSRFVGKKSRSTAPDDAAKRRARDAERLLGRFVFSKPRFLCFWSGMLSHLFWTSCSLCVLAILGVRMQGNRYDYCWRTSLEDERVVKKVVDWLGAPIERLGGVVPSDADVERLFVEERWRLDGLTPKGLDASPALLLALAQRSEEGDSASLAELIAAGRMDAPTRARWSHFLLSAVFVWCVAPRCCLAAAYYLLLLSALREFRPNLKEPYFRELIDRAEAYSTTTVSCSVEDGLDGDADVATRWDRPKALTEPNVAANLTPVEEPEAELSPVEEPESETSPVEAPESETSPVEEPEAEASPVEEPEPETSPVEEPELETSPVALALGYDATISDERWLALFDGVRTPTLFGDVAADPTTKKTFKIWALDRGAAVDVAAVLTDVSLPPARHCVKFFRDALAANLSNARVFVVLSGGEKLRRKFGKTAERAVAERVEDWKSVLAELTRTTGVPFEPAFFDADLDLPEPREALRRRLRAAALGENAVDEKTSNRRDFAKWNAAAARIVDEARAIFAENREETKNGESGQNGQNGENGEERDRRRVALLCADVFAIYREEVETATAAGVAEIERREGRSAWRENLLNRAAELVERSVDGGRAFGGDLVEACRADGLGGDFFERKLAAALGLSAKMRTFCGALSPRCALAVGTLGVSVPVVATFAPLFVGAASTAAVASALASLGTLLPTSLASGATAAALGAVAPASLAACKKKLVGRLNGLRTGSGASATAGLSAVPEAVADGEKAARSDSDGENSVAPESEAVASATAVVCVAATWAVALELQGWPEDRIVAALPVALRPVETAVFDSEDATRRALTETRNEIRKLREKLGEAQ